MVCITSNDPPPPRTGSKHDCMGLNKTGTWTKIAAQGSLLIFLLHGRGKNNAEGDLFRQPVPYPPPPPAYTHTPPGWGWVGRGDVAPTMGKYLVVSCSANEFQLTNNALFGVLLGGGGGVRLTFCNIQESIYFFV